MSGPKRGTWEFYYNPTPTRVADLEEFAARQDAWLERHGPFLQRYLSSQKLAEAFAARDYVQNCIDEEDPDAGFDAYGAAWDLFNSLNRQAVEAKQQAQLQRQFMEQQRQARQQQESAVLLAACREAWHIPESQTLLCRWMDSPERRRLAAALEAAAVGSPGQVQTKARRWQDDFRSALATATRRAEENARGVARCRPALSAARRALDSLNASILPDSQQKSFKQLKSRLRAQVEEALSIEDLREIQSLIGQLNDLAAKFRPRIKAAELEKASQVWRDALARCGYSVVTRKGPDGAVILQASSFPMKSLNVEVRPDTEEVRLDVNGKHDHLQCVKDVQSLQAELARQGVQLTMTDWGSGKPGSVNQRQTSGISIGGNR